MQTRVIFDYNNLACRCVHLQQVKSNDDRSWSLMSYMIFNVMYDFLNSISEFLEPNDSVETILAIDSHDGYWRRELYPPYKIDRAKKRRDDGVDWERAFQEFEKLSNAIKDFTPWKVIKASKCEADDVIYVLSTNTENSVIIHSADSDYLQLVSDWVSLYMPHLGEYAEFPRVCKISGQEVYCETPEMYLQYAILTGQGGKDNVYNVKTPTDFDGARKPGFGVKAAEKVIKSCAGIEEELQMLGLFENYTRNRQLIDMRKLPERYYSLINSIYNDYESKPVDIDGLLSVYDWPSLVANKDNISDKIMLLSTGIPDRNTDDDDAHQGVQSEEETFEFTI